MAPRTKLAQLIARMEGFGLPSAIPTVRHNPGDLRHSPHSSHQGIGPNDIGIIDTDKHGWEDLERQLQLYADRGMTVREMVSAYAPPVENVTENYLEYICHFLPCEPLASVQSVLAIPAEGD